MSVKGSKGKMGAIGAKGVAMFIGTAQSSINQLGNLYGVPEEKILLGSCAEPPDTKECILYGNIVGMGEYSATTGYDGTKNAKGNGLMIVIIFLSLLGMYLGNNFINAILISVLFPTLQILQERR